jgi:AraC-like DNA-binding protein
MADGRGMVQQDGNQADLGPTDLAIIDPARPVRYASTATRHVTLMVPRHLLRLKHDDVTRLSAVQINGTRGPGVLISSLARSMMRTADGLNSDEAARVGSAVSDLISVMLLAQLGRTHPDADHLLRARILTFIETRLADRNLSPPSIAMTHHISVRKLHQLFEEELVTVAAFIRQRRLERCRHDLAEPALSRLTIAAIAARWGIHDPGHFSRLFKAAYGQTAAEYRLLHHFPQPVASLPLLELPVHRLPGRQIDRQLPAGTPGPHHVQDL